MSAVLTILYLTLFGTAAITVALAVQRHRIGERLVQDMDDNAAWAPRALRVPVTTSTPRPSRRDAA